MSLSVTCPRCESKYQLDAGMRGKRMRCPNPICRAVFEVRDDADAPAPSSPVAPEPKAKETPPPAPKPVEVKKPEPVKIAPIAPTPSDFPDDFPGDDVTAPVFLTPSPSPARRGEPEAVATEAWQPEALAAPPLREEIVSEPTRITVTPPPPVKRRRALWVIGAMLLALGLVAAVGYWRIRGSIESNEAERYQRAEEKYKEHQFADASAALQKLHADFPDSPHNKKYRFLAELSDVRQAVYAREETDKSLQRVLQLTGMYKGDPLVKERESDLWETLAFLADELTKSAERDKAPTLLTHARLAWTEAKKYLPPSGVSQAERERKLDAERTRIDQILTAHFERENVLTALKKHLEHSNAASVQEAWALVEKSKRQDDTEIRGLLVELVKAHREQVKFVPAETQAKSPSLAEDRLPSLSVTPSVKAERTIAGTHPLVLSLARGVLYALEPANGELRWARRLGIDTNLLPLRVPADAITPELLLALSSDQRSLSALNAVTGEVLWKTPLSEACVGQPVLVDRQVLVPTLAGRIDEIEIGEGRLLGSYHVGQPLTLGGVRQPGTSLVYFPADEFCLYVIDITNRICTNILYTRHPAGSLRGLPAMVSSDKGAVLLWSQTKGLDRCEIKPYELPIQQHDQKPTEPILQMSAMSASPWCQSDRLAFATETGFLSLWGVRQKGTRDPLLFPLLKQDFPIDASKSLGHCQVVHADAEKYWTLTRGVLRCVQSTFEPAQGPDLSIRWTQPTTLGRLLHAAQTRHEPDGKRILFLTTQAEQQPTCLTTAVDADDGKILWQRQLGVLPQRMPVAIGGQIVIRDARGLLRFEAGKTEGKAEPRWRQDGAWLLQQPSTDGIDILLVNENSYVQLSGPRGATKLQAWIGSVVGEEKPRRLDIALPATLQGTPALGEGYLLLPLANGIIVRANLQDGSLLKGSDWRAVGAEDEAQGHIVMLGATEFIRTDGSRGLARIVSADGKNWDQRAELKLAHRIIRAPVLLPATDAAKLRLCVADNSNALTLLDADRLTVLKSWSMTGKITAGPFIRAGKIGCVVGRNRLIWLDPSQDKLLWEYSFDADIVGMPQLIDGVLVVADVAGQFLALDPPSGGRLGATMTLRANVAATAAPMPFGAGRAFVPLTDGTIILVPLEKLRTAK